MDTDAIIGRVITRSYAIEKLLRKHYPNAKAGLHAAINSVEEILPAVLVRTIRVVAVIRNAAAHPDGFKPDTVPPDFERLCNEIELLIPYFASQQHAKPAQPPKEPKSQIAKPQAPAEKSKALKSNKESQNSDVVANTSANPAKPPWTTEEEKQLTDGFEAQATIQELAKATNRSMASVQRRLIKLGKLAPDQCKTYPPESQ